MASPTLVIRRIVVTGRLRLDLRLRQGLNVLYASPLDHDPRSTNKAGKTALVELIQHALGKRHRSIESFHFAPIADQLDTLWLEGEFNGSVLTIGRSLTSIGARAMVREASYVEGIKDLPSDLVDIADLSNVLLRKLEIPEVAVKTLEGNLDPLTFPSLMRAFILHQNDSFGGILDKVQPERRKTDIIGFLTGIIPRSAFDYEKRLADIQTRAQQVRSRFEHVSEWLRSQGVPSAAEASRRLSEASARLEDARNRQHSIQHSIRSRGVAQAAREVTGHTEYIRRQLLDVQAQKSEIERHLANLREESGRIHALLTSLRDDARKATRLQASTTVLSTVDFDICPRCLLEITPDMRRREEHARCCLCNRPLAASSDTPPRLAPRAEDIQEQIEEAEGILQDLEHELVGTSAAAQRLAETEQTLSTSLDREVAAYISPSVDALLAQSNETSLLEIAVTQARTVFEQAHTLQAMQTELTELLRAEDEIRGELAEARRRSRARIRQLRDIYAHALEQVGFPSLETVDIDRRTLMPIINGQLYVHTGTAFRGLATLCYHTSLLELSLVENTYFPQLLVIDSPAVGDLNDENHDRMLQFLARMSSVFPFEPGGEDSNENWQVILTTRRTIPELTRNTVMEISGGPGRMLLR